MNDFRKVSQEITKDLQDIRKDARKSFFNSAEDMLRGIVQRFYSGAGRDSLGRRTGRAAKSWVVERVKDDSTQLVLSVNSHGVPYSDFTRIREIRPKSSKYLVIPVGPALTSAGVARYPGNADGKGSIAQAESRLTMTEPTTRRGYESVFSGKKQSPLAWIRKGDSIFVLAKPGVRGPGITARNRLLFVLKRSVKLPAYTRGIYPFVDSMESRLFAELRNM